MQSRNSPQKIVSVSAKKIIVLNLPNEEQITRRYMCSYVSPESLMPPLELISCASVLRNSFNAEVILIDAIAEKLSFETTLKRIQLFKPDVIISITGFECYEQDVNILKAFKQNLQSTSFIVFGHYATHFPEETLKHSGCDYVILGEPELVLMELAKVFFEQKNRLGDVSGIAFYENEKLVVSGMPGRIKDPNELPMPAYDLLPDGNHYYEPLLAQPYGMIQTVRGCPYQCNYCVKSYGTKLTQLTTERVIAEIQEWIKLHKVKSIRFIDDTFTISKRRVIELCKAMLENNIKIEWACLSRTDNLDEEMLQWMKKAGCKRIYFGMESGSQRMLDIYKKEIKTEDAIKSLHLCRLVGIETAAFFMSGHPEETEQDFKETLAFAKAAKLNFASFNPLTPYPGTGLFNELKEQLSFSIYPYKNEWKNQSVYENFERRKQLFYNGFYMRLGFVTGNILLVVNNLRQILIMAWGLLRYLWWDKQFVISGLKGRGDK